MPTEQTDAIVLRVHPWSETSLIGSLFTRDFGKVSVIAKGARRPKSPFEAALDLLSVCRVVFIAKSGDSLSVLTEAKLDRRFRTVNRELLRLYCGYYVAELLEKFTEDGVSQPELFDLANDTLEQLGDTEFEIRALVLRFEIQLLRLLGHLPSLRRCVHCGNEVPSQRWVIYGGTAGGVFCPACTAGHKQLLRISPSVRDYLESFSIDRWRTIPLTEYTPDSRPVVRAVMVKTLTALLEQKLKLHPYLEELGR